MKCFRTILIFLVLQSHMSSKHNGARDTSHGVAVRLWSCSHTDIFVLSNKNCSLTNFCFTICLIVYFSRHPFKCLAVCCLHNCQRKRKRQKGETKSLRWGDGLAKKTQPAMLGGRRRGDWQTELTRVGSQNNRVAAVSLVFKLSPHT